MVNETINKRDLKKIQKVISKDDFGLSITDIEKKTKILRCKIRILIAYMLGSKIIKERNFGMSKVYSLQ